MMRMLAVADDLTGAAEIAGLGHRFGLEARILVEEALVDGVLTAGIGEGGAAAVASPRARHGLTVIDTDSRLLPASEAGERVAAALRGVRATDLDLVFKKVDSVLRGPVLAEVEASLDALGLARAVLLPANPSRGRTIVGGEYRIAGVPLDRTEFARDPHSPARSAEVLEILGRSAIREVRSLAPGAELPPGGISVGDATRPEDVAVWAARVDRETLAAGAADFFEALLRHLGPVEVRAVPPRRGGKTLLVSGSASAASAETLERAASLGVPTLSMPEALLAPTASYDAELESLASAVASALSRRGLAILTIGRTFRGTEGGGERHLTRALADATARVLALERVDDLLVEGGATSSAIVRGLGWRELTVTSEIAPGIVSLAVPAVPAVNPRRITLKPGSYPWPEGPWPEGLYSPERGPVF